MTFIRLDKPVNIKWRLHASITSIPRSQKVIVNCDIYENEVYHRVW